MNTNPRIQNIGEAVILTAYNICSDDVVELACRLDAQYRRDAIFLFNAPTRVAILKLKIGDGEYLWEGGWARNWETLFGHEVKLCENLPIDTKGGHTIIFANRTYAARQGWIEWPTDLAWLCEYCGKANAGTRAGCVSCGGPRSWADYGIG